MKTPNDQQREEMAKIREQYIEISKCTLPADMPQAKKAISAIYQELGYAPPMFIRCNGPDEAQYYIHHAKELEKTAGLPKSESELQSILDREAMKHKKVDYTSTSLWGAFDSCWISYNVAYYQIVEPLEDKKSAKLLEMMDILCKSALFWYAFEKVCFVCDRPISICTDEDLQLHNLHGPAIEYMDGLKVYRVHGIPVPEEYIEHPEGITVQMIDAERNAELARIMIDLYGRMRYFQDAGLRPLDKSTKHPGVELYGREWADGTKALYAKLQDPFENVDGVKEEYLFRVPPEENTADKAVAWHHYCTEKEYNPVVET